MIYFDPDGRDSTAKKPSPSAQGNAPTLCWNNHSCAIDSSPADGGFGDGTATNADRDLGLMLTELVLDGEFGMTAYSIGADGHASDLSSSDRGSLQHVMAHALTMSPSLRAEVEFLLMGPSTLTSNDTQIAVNHQNEDQGTPIKQGVFQIQFNPNDTGATWQGGLFGAGNSSGGRSRLLPSSPDSSLAHEIDHAFRFSQGRFETSDGGKWEEMGAVKFENVYRWESGQMSRDAYLVDPGNIPAY